MVVGRVRRRKVSELEVRRHSERVAPVPFAMTGQRRVDGEAQRGIPGGDGAIHEVARDSTIAVHVQLEPARSARRPGDGLETPVGDGARAEDRVLRGRARGPWLPPRRRDTARESPSVPRAPGTTPACPGRWSPVSACRRRAASGAEVGCATRPLGFPRASIRRRRRRRCSRRATDRVARAPAARGCRDSGCRSSSWEDGLSNVRAPGPFVEDWRLWLETDPSSFRPSHGRLSSQPLHPHPGL